ncbi:hypothetical protein CL622_01315 [archaeon]|nr:hypothetical protein [archaeon]|tara:strand:+ start:86 stop:493 length:408 start_codon:yes stop_codon:yes gene_type:complete
MKPKKLYRSKQDRMIAGVCGGIAEHFNIDTVWVRLAAVLLALVHGVGIILYIIAWIIVPENPNQTAVKGKVINVKIEKKKEHNYSGKGAVLFGTILVVLGGILLLDKLFSWISFKVLWPVLLIVIGVFFLARRIK